MTTQQQNIAIAEWLGWTGIEQTGLLIAGGSWIGYPPKNPIIGMKVPIPGYTRDFTEIRSAVTRLAENPMEPNGQTYVSMLTLVALGAGRWYDELSSIELLQVINATAEQRSEALLKCIGGWREKE